MTTSDEIRDAAREVAGRVAAGIRDDRGVENLASEITSLIGLVVAKDREDHATGGLPAAWKAPQAPAGLVLVAADPVMAEDAQTAADGPCSFFTASFTNSLRCEQCCELYENHTNARWKRFADVVEAGLDVLLNTDQRGVASGHIVSGAMAVSDEEKRSLALTVAGLRVENETLKQQVKVLEGKQS